MKDYDFEGEAKQLHGAASKAEVADALRRAYAAGQASGGDDLAHLVTLASTHAGWTGVGDVCSDGDIAVEVSALLSALKAQAVKP